MHLLPTTIMRKMKYLSILLFAFLFLASFTPPRLKPVKIGNAVTVSLPADFQVMPDEVIATKYPAPRKPLGAFTSPNGQADFIVSERPSTFQPEDLALLQQFYRSSITSKYSQVSFIREEVKEINRRKYLTFEFTSTMRDEDRRSNKLAPIRRYTLVQYTIVPDSAQDKAKAAAKTRDKDNVSGRLLVFTFNTPIDLKEAWQETARKIMQSIKLTSS
jgi:hypothetical protein